MQQLESLQFTEVRAVANVKPSLSDLKEKKLVMNLNMTEKSVNLRNK